MTWQPTPDFHDSKIINTDMDKLSRFAQRNPCQIIILMGMVHLILAQTDVLVAPCSSSFVV